MVDILDLTPDEADSLANVFDVIPISHLVMIAKEIDTINRNGEYGTLTITIKAKRIALLLTTVSKKLV